MSSSEFLRLHLDGARFEDGAVPLKVLANLVTLQKMVIDIARWRFMESNPHRQRVPHGFINKIDLKLTGIERGSATPVISITETEPLRNCSLFSYRNYYEEGRDDIINTIATASKNSKSKISCPFPVGYLQHLNRFESNLNENEHLDLQTPNGALQARLSRESLHRLLQLSTTSDLSEKVVLRGEVPEVDQARKTFELQQIYGRKIVVPILDRYQETIISALNGYRSNTRISVHGTGQYNRHNRLSGLKTIEQILPLDPLDVPARLDELRAMRDGWLEGTGKAPSQAGLDWLSSRFQHHYPDDLPLPHTFPEPEGGIEMEWSLGSYSVILEINLDTHSGAWLGFAEQTNNEDERELDLNDNGDWEWLISEIRRVVEIDS